MKIRLVLSPLATVTEKAFDQYYAYRYLNQMLSRVLVDNKAYRKTQVVKTAHKALALLANNEQTG